MSTNSSISVINHDGKIISVYCHWDGYPSYNGRMLVEHYSDYAKALALVNLGDISLLRKSIECPDDHCFKAPSPDCTVFYGRDRGETDVGPHIFDNYGDVMKANRQEYNYYYDGESWLVNGELITWEIIAAD